MTSKDTRSVATSASEAFDRLLIEAIGISGRIASELADGEFPRGLDWGHVGDMAETVRGLRDVSDRMFAEGEHAPDEGAQEGSTTMTEYTRTHGYDPRGPGADSRYGDRPISDTRDAVAEALEDARQAWRDWQDSWDAVRTAMRAAGMSTSRIDAYRVGSGFDEGGGQSLAGWLDEIERDLDGDARED